MKKVKPIKTMLLIICSIIILFFISVRIIVYWAFEDMNGLPQGELINESTSPQGTYTVKSYLCNGGATVSYAVRSELIYNKGIKRTRNIYWDYKTEEAKVTWWSNESAVIINKHQIDIPKGSYDWRKDKNYGD